MGHDATAAAAVPRVAILGGGVAGCAAASRLSRLGAHVTLIEMGRGTGGRATTRRTRGDKRIEVDLGAPFAEIMTAEGLAMVRELAGKGYVEAFTGIAGRLKPGSSSLMVTEEQPDKELFSGTPNMSRWCEGLLHGATVQTMFGSIVQGLQAVRTDEGTVAGWRLKDKDGELLIECDWLVVTGSGVAHSRWTKTFGGPPPLVEAATHLNDVKLDAAIAAIEGITARPVHVVWLGFQGDAAEAWSALPFSIAEIEGDETIAKIVVQRRNGMVFVVAHSTHKFADRNQDAYGSTSTSSKINNANNASREEEVLAELVKGLERCVAGFGLRLPLLDPWLAFASSTQAATYGPLLHRWGNAFPQLSAQISVEDVSAPASRVVFAGDYVGQRCGSIEGAMLSGSAAAELLMAHVSG